MMTRMLKLALLLGTIVVGCCPVAREAFHRQDTAIPAIWDMVLLERAPGFRWLDRTDTVRSLLYDGPPYKDKSKTDVFAYYATPGTLSGDPARDINLPGIVLVHGGGGTAFREWTELWAERGYAAIAMDLYGYMPDGQKLENGGPSARDNGPNTFNAFSGIDRPLNAQWPYHAVSNVVLANSLLRSMPEVDADRIAVTGISWGGYLTCIAVGLDNRFAVAVPVYGCGFLYENSVWLPDFEKLSPGQKARWIEWFEPSRYVGAAKMPMFFVNGTNDFAYPIDSWAKTAALPKTPPLLRLTVNMPHNHPHGWAPQEIDLFIDHYFRGGAPLPTVTSEAVENGQIVAMVEAQTQLMGATLHYTTQDSPINKRQWADIEMTIAENRISAPLPDDATVWFVTVRDDRDAIVSGKAHIVDGPGR